MSGRYDKPVNVESIADAAWMKLVSRIAMILAPAMMFYLVSQVQNFAQQVSGMEITVQKIADQFAVVDAQYTDLLRRVNMLEVQKGQSGP